MRTILHSDLNNCYASIESISHPEYRKIPFAVGGDEELRHGIILAKNECAKKYGIKTGEPLLTARQKCPDLKVVKPNFELYDKYCTAVRELYGEYTDMVEPFGIDESWLDTTGSVSLFGEGKKIAEEIRARVKKEFDLTVSVGVSYNKVFAKLGSDYKKPDAVTVITPENYREIVWELPVEDLLYVGKSTKNKLNGCGIRSIGELARTSETFLYSKLGKHGKMLHIYANGLDTSPVTRVSEADVVKSIGNSTTAPRDMQNLADVNIVFHYLAEQVCRRLRSHSLKCNTVQIYARRKDLTSFERQTRLKNPTDISGVVCEAAINLMRLNYSFEQPLRAIGIRTSDLVDSNAPVQLSFFEDAEHTEKMRSIDMLKDKINAKYGKRSIYRAVLMSDKTLLPEYNKEIYSACFNSH